MTERDTTEPNPVRAPFVRLIVACVLFSLWLGTLLVGWSLGGLVHLFLVAGLILLPWKSLRAG